MNKRIDLLNQNELIRQHPHLAQAIDLAETEFESQLPNSFSFSSINFDNGITIARAGDFYFLSPAPNVHFIPFDNLTSINLYVSSLFSQASSKSELDPSWKAFWLQQISKL